MISCLLCAPNWGPGPQSRHVPGLGIELATFWFAGWHSIHWATSARAKLVNFCEAILILKMKEDIQHFHHIMLYYFKKGKNVTEMQKKICAVYGEGAVTD